MNKQFAAACTGLTDMSRTPAAPSHDDEIAGTICLGSSDFLVGLEETALQRVFDERLSLSPGAEGLLAAAKQARIKTLLVSGGFTFFTSRLQARLGIDFAHSNTLDIVDGKLTVRITGLLCGAAGKAQHVRQTAAASGLQREQVIVIGDGANDLQMMQEAALSVAYHANPVVQAQASVALNFVGLDEALALSDKMPKL